MFSIAHTCVTLLAGAGIALGVTHLLRNPGQAIEVLHPVAKHVISRKLKVPTDFCLSGEGRKEFVEAYTAYYNNGIDYILLLDASFKELTSFSKKYLSVTTKNDPGVVVKAAAPLFFALCDFSKADYVQRLTTVVLPAGNDFSHKFGQTMLTHAKELGDKIGKPKDNREERKLFGKFVLNKARVACKLKNFVVDYLPDAVLDPEQSIIPGALDGVFAQTKRLAKTSGSKGLKRRVNKILKKCN